MKRRGQHLRFTAVVKDGRRELLVAELGGIRGVSRDMDMDEALADLVLALEAELAAVRRASDLVRELTAAMEKVLA